MKIERTLFDTWVKTTDNKFLKVTVTEHLHDKETGDQLITKSLYLDGKQI